MCSEQSNPILRDSSKFCKFYSDNPKIVLDCPFLLPNPSSNLTAGGGDGGGRRRGHPREEEASGMEEEREPRFLTEEEVEKNLGRRSKGSLRTAGCSPMSPRRTLGRRWRFAAVEEKKKTMKIPFVITPSESQMSELHVSSLPDLLPLLVPSAQLLSRAPISSFPVGAVGLGSSGRIYVGVNLEFPSLPLHHSVHAEQFLVTKALLHAEPSLRLIAVSAAPCVPGLGLRGRRRGGGS